MQRLYRGAARVTSVSTLDWGKGAAGEKPEAAPTRGVEAEQRTHNPGAVRAQACTLAFSSKGSEAAPLLCAGLWFLGTANTVLQERKLIQRLTPAKAQG